MEGQYSKKPLKSWHRHSVFLSHLLDVNSVSGKHIHKLRGLSALLITMAQAEISIVSPCEDFSWVCKKNENHIATISPPAHHCFSVMQIYGNIRKR